MGRIGSGGSEAEGAAQRSTALLEKGGKEHSASASAFVLSSWVLLTESPSGGCILRFSDKCLQFSSVLFVFSFLFIPDHLAEPVGCFSFIIPHGLDEERLCFHGCLLMGFVPSADPWVPHVMSFFSLEAVLTGQTEAVSSQVGNWTRGNGFK